MFYPILNVPGFSGQLTLCNFPPNNWESKPPLPCWVKLIWSDDKVWQIRSWKHLMPNEFTTITNDDIAHFAHLQHTCFAYLSDSPEDGALAELPYVQDLSTEIPVWRSTIGLKHLLSRAYTSYQGEIPYPPPKPGTLLSFAPLLQFGRLSNYLILLSLERSPIVRETQLKVYKSADRLLDVVSVRSNQVNCINLDSFDFEPTDLPIFTCLDLIGIPLILTVSDDGHYLSLEHTHPPASLVVHGPRRKLQSHLKRNWFSRL
jgi:hypothetical protein